MVERIWKNTWVHLYSETLYMTLAKNDEKRCVSLYFSSRLDSHTVKWRCSYTGVQRKMMRSHSLTSIISPRRSRALMTDDGGSSDTRLVVPPSSTSSEAFLVRPYGFSVNSNTLFVYVRICNKGRRRHQ